MAPWSSWLAWPFPRSLSLMAASSKGEESLWVSCFKSPGSFWVLLHVAQVLPIQDRGNGRRALNPRTAMPFLLHPRPCYDNSPLTFPREGASPQSPTLQYRRTHSDLSKMNATSTWCLTDGGEELLLMTGEVVHDRPSTLWACPSLPGCGAKARGPGGHGVQKWGCRVTGNSSST